MSEPEYTRTRYRPGTGPSCLEMANAPCRIVAPTAVPDFRRRRLEQDGSL